MADAHALLSPSSAHRWINCTPSVRLEEGVEDRGSEFAREGSLAHAIAARKLLGILGRPHEAEDREISELAEEFHTDEMEEHTDTYVSIVLEKFNEAKRRSKDARLLVEVRLDFRAFLPDSFGTGDAVIIADRLIEVIDFKYGKGVRVDAVLNPQMMIYALGAIEAYGFDYDIRQVKMTIVQPRMDNISEYQADVAALESWKDTVLAPAAEKAFSGSGEQRPGDWCRFCKVRTRCTAIAREARRVCSDDFREVRLIGDDEVPGLLALLPMLKSWLEDFASWALDRAINGTAFDGWKLVEGRSVRAITDPDALLGALLVQGFQRDDLLKKPELKTLGDLEKLVGKKKFAEISKPYVRKPKGKPTLVEASDKRPEWKPKESASEDFGGSEI